MVDKDWACTSSLSKPFSFSAVVGITLESLFLFFFF